MANSEPERFTISRAEFLTTASKAEQFPRQGVPEVAFFGRSNVGKSSLLNAVLERKNLAFTGKTPGRTKLLNFFAVGMKDRSLDPPVVCEGLFVDVPGYGYASVAQTERRDWDRLLGSYLGERPPLCAVILLIDGRREVQDEERWVAGAAAGRELIVVVTKGDKLSRSEREAARRRVSESLQLSSDDVIVTSTQSERIGISELRTRIALAVMACGVS